MPPFATPRTPLPESRVALVTTGGVHLKNQPPFDIDDPIGDCSCREVPSETRPEDLTWTHFYHAPERAESGDLDGLFPLRTLREIATDGVIGSINDRHFSFMGAIHDAGPLIDETAPEVAGKLLRDGVDAVLVTPSCPLCHRNAALVAQEIERSGIPTVTLSMEGGMDAPRVGRVGFAYNEPCGPPGEAGLHRAVVLAALDLVWEADLKGEVRLPFGW
ncbi:glycine/sarcosine/betaine reductase selenoprotein B family protein [Rubrobacter indicoceani]|uniref:glycine/sarcosine/betaine reductase selenoprotein B family protein n=1 Tax=Rubrobacter indicoceani TaxID=2051957 RepID=UPI0013C4309F|nr:glycine/sarcosine/betaine reductase selenoprotein B family protein [Rubrobacter indicoceani]